MFSFSLISPPATEPVTLDDAKAHAKIDSASENALVSSLITAARQWAEQYTNRAFITQKWQLALDYAPSTGGINLPRSPLQSVESVMSYSNADDANLWNAENYFVDTLKEPGRITLRSGATWPLPTRPANGLIITYIAGYGDDASTVPAPIKTAICQLVAHWLEHRGDAPTAPSARNGATIAPAAAVPLVIQSLLNPYRVRYAGA